jgi:hypothetical protein
MSVAIAIVDDIYGRMAVLSTQWRISLHLSGGWVQMGLVDMGMKAQLASITRGFAF